MSRPTKRRPRAHALLHPVAQAIERAQVTASAEHLQTLALMTADGVRAPLLIDDCIKMIALGVSASGGYDLGDDADQLLRDCAVALTEMGNDSQRWRVRHARLVADAVEIAAPVLPAMSPADRQRAAAHVLALEALAEARVRAQRSGVPA